jgi:hypothetical protein
VQQVGGMNYVLAREPEPVYEIKKETGNLETESVTSDQ